jgi:hypothetical protein
MMIDYRKWRVAKLAPKKYGLKPDPEPAEKPMSHEDALLALYDDPEYDADKAAFSAWRAARQAGDITAQSVDRTGTPTPA